MVFDNPAFIGDEDSTSKTSKYTNGSIELKSSAKCEIGDENGNSRLHEVIFTFGFYCKTNLAILTLNKY